MESLRDILKREVDLSTMEGLCQAVSLAGSSVAGIPLVPTIHEGQIRKFQSASARLAAYQEFRIPKKTGGTRRILAPTGELKQILTSLCAVLNAIYEPTDAAMGFVCGRSVVTNASHHLHRNYVLNLDLQDFFPSISVAQVERSLVHEGVSPLVAAVLSTICCYPRKVGNHYMQHLPQGAPTSPILSNICCRSLDNQLLGLARRFHLTYTRYADDITFSSNHNVYQPDGPFWMELRRIIRSQNFTLNERKTRLLRSGTRQEVTGITVNQRPNVSRKYVKNLRAMIHQMAHMPLSQHQLNIVRGKLNYLRMVKGPDDTTYRSLCIRLNRAIKDRTPAR